MNSSKSDYPSFLLDLPAEKHSSLDPGRCWFSLTCCFPKDDVTTVTTQQHERQTNYSILKDVVADQDETERTTLEEDDDGGKYIFVDTSNVVRGYVLTQEKCEQRMDMDKMVGETA